jgi:hypothetical protein
MQRYYNCDEDGKLNYSGSNLCVKQNEESSESIISESIKTNKILISLFFPLDIYWNITCKTKNKLFLTQVLAP